MKRVWAVAMMVIFAAFFASAGRGNAEEMIVCASTTSTQNSGLFDYLLPMFQKKSGITVKVVAAGTGAALEIGRRGDADVLLVHAKDDELKMVAEGWFVNRHDLMYNDFVIAGPLSDPAGVRGLKDAKKALGMIVSAGRVFVSRGDDSGTHRKELSLWRGADIDPRGRGWYLEVGQGMAKTLRIAGEKQAYTLSDRGTYLSVKDKERIDLAVLVEGDPLLFNQYGVMAVNPEKHGHVRSEEAMAFINWLVSEEGRKAIASFKDDRGNQLFFPNAGK